MSRPRDIIPRPTIRKKNESQLEVEDTIQHCNIPPFQRGPDAKRAIYRFLKSVAQLKLLPDSVVFKLCDSCILESSDGADFPVLASDGFFIVLRGTAELISGSLDNCGSKLSAGDSFGSLSDEEAHTASGGPVVVCARECCDILRIPSNAYRCISQMEATRAMNETICLLQSCKFFSGWPLSSVKEFAAVVNWKTFAVGERILSEEEVSTVFCIVKSGRCTILKKLLATDRHHRVKSRHLVVVGSLGTGDCFGEQFSGSPLYYTVDTDEPLIVACIDKASIAGMDETMQALYRQSVERISTALSMDEVKRLFAKQQYKEDWNKQKAGIINDTLTTRGIVPGCSKWSRNFKGDGKL